MVHDIAKSVYYFSRDVRSPAACNSLRYLAQLQICRRFALTQSMSFLYFLCTLPSRNELESHILHIVIQRITRAWHGSGMRTQCKHQKHCEAKSNIQHQEGHAEARKACPNPWITYGPGPRVFYIPHTPLPLHCFPHNPSCSSKHFALRSSPFSRFPKLALVFRMPNYFIRYVRSRLPYPPLPLPRLLFTTTASLSPLCI